jgi:hypothetical protein
VKNKFSFLLLLLPLLFTACSTDLDVTGKYKETMVVYGLLDQAQSKQYIKINKAFLGQGSAIQMAQIKDSSQFVNALNVVLQRIMNGTVISTYNLQPDNTIPKDAGAFYGPDQANAIYSFNSTPGSASELNPDSEYKLLVKNTETGTIVSSTTALINDFNITNPLNNTNPFSFYSNAQSLPILHFPVIWNSAKNGRAHQLTLRFNYTDSTASGNVSKYIDWVFPEHVSKGLSGQEPMKDNILGQDFFSFVGIQLKNGDLSAQTSILGRISGKIDLLIAVGSDDLKAFIDVNKPSTGIIQEKPEYSNITNGLGIFTARYNKNPFLCNMSKPLNNSSISFLISGQYTSHLKFVR